MGIINLNLFVSNTYLNSETQYGALSWIPLTLKAFVFLFRKQKYPYTVEEIPLEPFTLSYYGQFDRNRIDIEISLIDRDVTVISHIPRYGMWELFSYIGGLIGCWLGISVWAFVDIIEANFWTLLRLIQKLKQKKSEKQVASPISSGSLHSEI
ncbi:hypothetical protein CDAR_208851 [Caerostris darwini]|uniref:Uncharacterized protein n=1 Tax=Caerostris darwini TaxID=1538125 RepID=A0AAV4Q631_9ARAC|nr:hypothetical protein CDAR_208851 [Caerostris darwini]